MKQLTKSFVLILLLLFCVILPAFAAYIPANGAFYSSGGIMTNQTVTGYFGGSDGGLYGIWFRSAVSTPYLGAIKIYSPKGCEGFGAYAHPLNTTVNSSSLPAKLKYGGNIVSTGTLVYSLSDVTGGFYMAYFMDTWNPSLIPDNTVLYLDFNRTKFNWRFGEIGKASQSEWQNNLISVGFTFSPPSADPANVYMPFTTTSNLYGHYSDYYDIWKFQYNTVQKTDVTSYLDLIRNIDGVLYKSRVMVNESYNGKNITIYDEWNSIDTRISNINHGRDIFITVWDSKLRKYTANFKLIAPLDIISIIVDKGSTINNKLLVEESTTAHLIGSIEGAKSIFWVWTEEKSDSSDIFNYRYKDYRYNNTISSWELFYDAFKNKNIITSPIPVSESEARNIQIQFNWSDSSTYWINNHPPNNFVQVSIFDSDNQLLGEAIKKLYVGSSLDNAITTIYIYDVRTGTYLADSKLYVYDETTSNYIINGEIISYKKVFEIPFFDEYIIWATHTDFTQSYAKSLGTVFYGNYMNYTPWVYSNTNIELWMNYIGTGMNQSVVLHIQNNEKLPIENALCKFTSTQSSDVITSTNNGDCWFSAIDTVNYTYQVSKDGYNTVTGSFYASGTIYKIITLELYTPTPTATITPTPSPTITPAPTGFINILFWYAAQLGLTADNTKLLIASAIIITFMGIIAYQTRNGIAALGAGGVGFIISLAAGLIPIWVFIAMIVVFGLLLAYRWNQQ